MDTIFALASAPGRAGVAVIRISGPHAFAAAKSLCGAGIPMRQPVLRTLRSKDGTPLDRGLIVLFPERQSFTGERIAELHIHGGRATVAAVSGALSALPFIRMAEAGEFTRRALMNNRLDLAEVEGLADLIDAETEDQRRQAMGVATGNLSAKCGLWRELLLSVRSKLVSAIDFSDEDIPEELYVEARRDLEDLREKLSRELSESKNSERVRDGWVVAIVGRPNVGKSTLLNRLAGREAALTSEIAGTTRDIIEVHMDLHGRSVTFLDTAGIRDTADPLELAGVRVARERASSADLRVFVLERDEVSTIPREQHDITVFGKADQLHGLYPGVSGQTGLGVDDLIQTVVDRISDMSPRETSLVSIRQKCAVEKALVFANEALSDLQKGESRLEFSIERIEAASEAVSEVTGRIGTEEVLGEIFLRFCIGK